MYRDVAVLVWILVALVSLVCQATEVGIACRIPIAASVWFTAFESWAIEVGLSGAGPLMLSLRAYPVSFIAGGLTLVPLASVGVALAFLPGDIIASGFFWLIGVEIPIRGTPLTLFGETAFTSFTHPPGGNPSGIGPAIGGRIDFPINLPKTDR